MRSIINEADLRSGMHIYYLLNTCGASGNPLQYNQDRDWNADCRAQQEAAHSWHFCWLLTLVDERAYKHLDICVFDVGDQYRLSLSNERHWLLRDGVAARSQVRRYLNGGDSVKEEQGDGVPSRILRVP